MESKGRLVSIISFAAAILCFFLPFVTVSCGDIKAFTLTGQQMATGTILTEPQAFGPPKSQKIDPDPFATVALFAGIAGLVFSILGRKMTGAAAISGIISAACLLFFRFHLQDQIQTQGQGIARVNFEMGFTLALLLVIAAAACNLGLIIKARQRQANMPQGGSFPGPLTVPPPTATTAGPENSAAILAGSTSSRFCTACGRPLQRNAHFCSECGKPLELSTSSTSFGNEV